MIEHKSTFYKITAAVAVLPVAFYTLSLFHSELLCDILSAINAAVASTILVYSYTKSNNKNSTGRSLVFCALACFSWCVADVLWTILAVLGHNPLKSMVIIFFYSLTNIFLGTAVLVFMFYQLSKWNSVQLLLDTFVISILSAILVWISFFHKESTWRAFFRKDGIISVSSITIDFLLIIGFILAVYSIRKGKIPTYIILFGFGILTYSVTDLGFYYSYANNTYIPNSLMDVIYSVSITIIAFGGLWRSMVNPLESAGNIKNTGDIKNIGIGRRWLFLFLFPLAALLYEGFVFKDAVHFLAAIIIYKAFSNQVQVIIKSDELYRKELNINNILEKRAAEQYSELIFLANHDTVTKLYNRRFFMKSLEESMKALLSNEMLATFLIDVDRFKIINDTLGHDVGDKVLIELSGRMQKCSKDQAVLARLGGDEFALFFRGRYSKDELASIAEKIIEACSVPIVVEDKTLNVTISLGISLYPQDSADRVTLMRNADIAMYRAKSLGYNRYTFYEPCLAEHREEA